MDAPPPDKARHLWIREWMLREMESYSLSSRLPSDRELAKKLKVAPLTVKRAMGDLERDGYVVRRQGKGTFLVSREKVVRVHSSDSAPNGKVLFAYPDYFSYDYWRRAHIAEEVALKNGLGLVEFKMHQLTTYRNLLEFAGAQDDIRGVMIDPVPGTITKKVFKSFDDLAVPVVLFAGTEFLTFGDRVYSFVPDWFKLGYLTARYLLDRGHESIGLIDNEPRGQDGGLTLKGFKHALREAGISTRALVRKQAAIAAWESSMEAGYHLMGDLLKSSSVTGAMIASIYGAIGAMRMLSERGMRVPEDMSLITHGEWGRHEEFTSPPLTTTRMDVEGQIRTAFDVITGEQTPTSKTFEADISIIERQSVAGVGKVAAAGASARLPKSRRQKK